MRDKVFKRNRKEKHLNKEITKAIRDMKGTNRIESQTRLDLSKESRIHKIKENGMKRKRKIPVSTIALIVIIAVITAMFFTDFYVGTMYDEFRNSAYFSLISLISFVFSIFMFGRNRK